MAFCSFEFHANSIKSDVAKLEEQFASLKKEKEVLANPVGRFKPYESYPKAPDLKRDRSAWSYSDEYLSKEQAELALQSWYSLCTTIRDRNKEVEAHNRVIFDKAVEFMLSLGLQKTENYRKTSRSVKWSKRQSAWLTSIEQQKGCGGGWSQVESSHKRLAKGIEERKEAKRKAEKQKERERKAAIAERQENLKIALLAQKYVTENAIECEDGEILDAILARDKYLCLGHWLMKNRGDWNDGPSYAEVGLSEFEIESTLDQEIHDEINSHITDWGGDGRVFRDCEHNYDSLFARCDSDLMKDYNTFLEMFPGT